MDRINIEQILDEIPLFFALDRSSRRYIKEKAAIVEYKKGELIYEEGSKPSFFYCVISGRIMVFTGGAEKRHAVLEYLHHGKYFGIISLLTGEPHSVSAKAINDSILLVIRKDDFDFLLKKIPELAIDLAHTLSRRLKNKDIHQKTIFESSVISVFSSYSQAGKSVYALNLALSLRQETKKPIIILDVCLKERTHSLVQRMSIGEGYTVADLSSSGLDYRGVRDLIVKDRSGIDVLFFNYSSDDESCIGRLVNIFTLLVNDYNYIILDLPASMDHFVFGALHQSDSVHILTSPETVDLKRTHNLIKRLKDDFVFHESKIKVIINEYKFSKLTHAQQVDLLGHAIYATLPRIEIKASDRLVIDEPGIEYSKTIKRISRQVGDRLVGLALGVGVAYGFCHIGVLKVIEEEKIPLDVIAGSSMGAIIASLWVTGYSADEILKIAREFKEPKYIWSIIDLTLPFSGFLKGNKLYNLLKKYLGNKTFYDVKLPLRIVASDLKQKEPIVMDKGPLIDAIMASCAMPGVFRPIALKESLLFDGGVIHPLPTEPLFSMGVNKIIAVNVTPSRQDIASQRRQLKDELTRTYEAVRKRKWFDLKDYFKEKLKNNILDSIFSSIEFMQSELAQKEAQLADIVLHPDTQGLHWLELSRADEFVKRGEAEARRNLSNIWKVVNE